MLKSGAGTRDYAIFLSKRVREVSKHRPEIRELRKTLLKIGGNELVPPNTEDPMTTFLIDFGIVFGGPVLLKTSNRHRPERTLCQIWRRRLYGVVGIGLGYALNDDGIWREHHFGVLREGVLELMSTKQRYFGLLLIGEAADGFVQTISS